MEKIKPHKIPGTFWEGVDEYPFYDDLDLAKLHTEFGKEAKSKSKGRGRRHRTGRDEDETEDAVEGTSQAGGSPNGTPRKRKPVAPRIDPNRAQNVLIRLSHFKVGGLGCLCTRPCACLCLSGGDLGDLAWRCAG